MESVNENLEYMANGTIFSYYIMVLRSTNAVVEKQRLRVRPRCRRGLGECSDASFAICVILIVRK